LLNMASMALASMCADFSDTGDRDATLTRYVISGNLITQITFRAPVRADAAVDYYRKRLTAKGWKAANSLSGILTAPADNGRKAVEAHFLKDDVKMSVSAVSGDGDDPTWVQVQISFLLPENFDEKFISPYPYGKTVVYKEVESGAVRSRNQVVACTEGPKIFFGYVIKKLAQTGWVESENLEQFRKMTGEGGNIRILSKNGERMTIVAAADTHHAWHYVFNTVENREK
jgi:hypothetical protein